MQREEFMFKAKCKAMSRLIDGHKKRVKFEDFYQLLLYTQNLEEAYLDRNTRPLDELFEGAQREE